MNTVRTAYFCRECGNESLRWEGRCPACGEWNSLVEAPAPERAGRGRGRTEGGAIRASEPSPLGAGPLADGGRIEIGLGDFDRVLGGGLVPGSVILLAGAPGIGKSTLMLQAAARLKESGGTVLYVSGEESVEQVRLRARRLGSGADGVVFLATTRLEDVQKAVEDATPDLLCVDSIQALTSDSLASAPGTVGQVRECAAVVHAAAKRRGTAACLIGHLTKSGAIAGPRTLEHLVDVVLVFEGQRSLGHRILRGSKNRFGSVDEIAAFRMTEEGLAPVEDPSSVFLSDRPVGVSGSAVAVPLQGTRPVLAEVQALTAPSRFGTPQRVCTGFSARRLSLLLAVLERRAGLSIGGSDVFLNVVGGLRLSDPAADLAVLAALLSAERDRPFPDTMAFIGEVGLGGELRGVLYGEARVRVAERCGFEDIVAPLSRGEAATMVSVRPIRHVRELEGLLEVGRET